MIYHIPRYIKPLILIQGELSDIVTSLKFYLRFFSITASDGTAVQGDDYSYLSGPEIQFSSGDREQLVAFSLLDDNVVEGGEVFTLQLQLQNPPQPNVFLGPNSILTVTIEDDDALQGM